ncbi:MAG TPA: hypothetical protein VD906_16095 [Caulobacteraceae bacterium]|nr:hypothetical protein [Caulobacteraceae bacterium]
MPWRPALLGLAATLLAGSTFAAEPKIDLLKNASRCLQTADLPICLLREVATVAPQDLRQDIALRTRPALLRAAGLPPLRPRAPEEATPGWHGPTGSQLFVDDAVDAVLARLEEGAPPDAALEPVGRLAPPTPADGFTETSQALHAYERLWRLTQAGAPGTSPAFARALLRAWEQELVARDFEADAARGLEGLGAAYAAIGDQQNARRVIDLGPAVFPNTRIGRLMAIGALEEAAQVSATADLSAHAAWLRQQDEKEWARIGAEQQAFAGKMAPAMRKLAEHFRAAGAEKEAAEIEAQLATLDAPGERPPRDFQMEALQDLNAARWLFVREATKAGRPDLARRVADELMRTPPEASEEGLPQLDPAPIVSVATPELAARWLDAVEKSVQPTIETNAPGVRRIAVGAVLEGWAALGQPQRAEAAYRRWLPLAREEAERNKDGGAFMTFSFPITEYLLESDRVAEAGPLVVGSPMMLMRNDFRRGRGMAAVDRYIRPTDDRWARHSVWSDCRRHAADFEAYTAGEACIARLTAQAEAPGQHAGLIDDALQLAASAAQAGELDEARRIYRKALADAAKLPDREYMSFVETKRSLLHIAKAELRAQGRLPPATEIAR